LRWLLLLLPFSVHAANVTSTTGWTCQATLPASMTIDSGSNRKVVISNLEEDNTPESAITSLGGVAPTETITYSETSTGGDHTHTDWIWNEAAIVSMSGSTISGTDGLEGGWCVGTIEDTNQAAISSHVGTNVDLSATQIAVTSTSSSGDLILSKFIKGTSVTGGWTTYDTLTEIGNIGAGARDVAFAAGNGGDSSTLGAHDGASAGEMTASALVFADASAVNNDWVRIRRNW